jgi:LuxR family transcriptional regulator, maltose regulon positive regulatory protein
MESIEQSDPAAAGIDDELAAMRLMILGWTDRAPELFETVEAVRGRSSRFGAFTRGLASNASAYRNMALGRCVEAERDLCQAREACEAIGALYVLSYSACFVAAIEFNCGEFATARTTLEGAMNRAIAEGQRYGGAGAVVATYLAQLLYEANDLDACEALLGDYLPIVVETGLPDHLILLHRIAARLHFRHGQREACQQILVQLNDLGARRGIRRLSAAAWLERSYAALRSGDADGARRALAIGSDEALWGGFGEFNLHASEIEDPLTSELRLRLVLGQSDQALPRIQLALQSAEAAGRRRRALRLQFLLAQMLEAARRRSEASTAFDSAILRTGGSGMSRVLADDTWATDSLVSRANVAGEPRAVALLRELTARAAPSDLKGPHIRRGSGRRASLDQPRDTNPAPGMERTLQQGNRARSVPDGEHRRNASAANLRETWHTQAHSGRGARARSRRDLTGAREREHPSALRRLSVTSLAKFNLTNSGYRFGHYAGDSDFLPCG